MNKLLKRSHHLSLSLGFLSIVAYLFNLVVLILLYPRITGFQKLAPIWETLGKVVALNIILIAFFHLISVLTLLTHLIKHKDTSSLLTSAITIGILSGLMILGDIALLSDIGKEYHQGWQTRGEWIILFISYGLHALYLAVGVFFLFTNLKKEDIQIVETVKDEVLFLSLFSTGWICGTLGLLTVTASLFTNIPAWIMIRAIPTFSLLILSPYLAILLIWILRQYLGDLSPGLDEKQTQDLTQAGFWTLLFTTAFLIIYFSLQISGITGGMWDLLWLPAYLFLALTIFSSLTLHFYRR